MTLKKTHKEVSSPSARRLLSQLKSSTKVDSDKGKARLLVSAREAEGSTVTTYEISVEGRAISGIFAALADHPNKEAVANALRDSVRDLVHLTAIASGVEVKR